MKPTVPRYTMLKKGFKFEDIPFGPHGTGSGVQACVEFENGEWASIVGAMWYDGYARLYGDGVHTFEVLSSLTDKTSDCVLSYQTRRQVMYHLKKLQSL